MIQEKEGLVYTNAKGKALLEANGLSVQHNSNFWRDMSPMYGFKFPKGQEQKYYDILRTERGVLVHHAGEE